MNFVKASAVTVLVLWLVAITAALPLPKFREPKAYFVGHAGFAVVIADFNRDGRPDIATVSDVHGSVSVLLGAPGGFQPYVEYSLATPAADIQAGDFDSDGSPDLVVVGEKSTSFSILFGNGDGTFKPAIIRLSRAE